MASGNVGFFISLAPSFKICFDQDQTLSCVKEDQRNLNCKSFSLGMILSSQM